MGLSGDCLFAVFTAKPLRTYRHFHQHSAVHNTHLPACVHSASNVLFHSQTIYDTFESQGSLMSVCKA